MFPVALDDTILYSWRVSPSIRLQNLPT